jgi:hypothetical protein
MKHVWQFIKDAIAAFLFFTLALTPYMVFIVRVDGKQYLAWLGMQAILVPPLGAVYSIIARKLKKKEEE